MLVPKRIVSTVPSQTELLWYLGLNDRVVGITKFCVHPRVWHREKVRIGGTKSLNISQILALKPDLVIANREENMREQILELADHVNVWVSEVSDLSDALHTIDQIGYITETHDVATALVSDIKAAFRLSMNEVRSFQKAIYLIWRKPYMAAARDTFIGDMLRFAGFENALPDSFRRYPELSLEQLVRFDPQWVLLSSEPYPFRERHMAELKEAMPDSRIVLVDGEFFSWYGSRLLLSADYFRSLRMETVSTKEL